MNYQRNKITKEIKIDNDADGDDLVMKRRKRVGVGENGNENVIVGGNETWKRTSGATGPSFLELQGPAEGSPAQNDSPLKPGRLQWFQVTCRA